MQATIGLFSAIVAWNSFKSFERTEDISLKFFALAFLFFSLHSWTLVSGVLMSEVLNMGILKPSAILAKVLLHGGVLFLLQAPLFQKRKFFQKYNGFVVIVIVLLSLLGAYYQYVSESPIYVTENGFIVENISNPLLYVSILLPLYFLVGFFVCYLMSALPRYLSFFSAKIYLFSVGMLVMLFGYSLYITSTGSFDSMIGVANVFVGDLLIVTAILMPSVRRFLIRNNQSYTKV